MDISQIKNIKCPSCNQTAPIEVWDVYRDYNMTVTDLLNSSREGKVTFMCPICNELIFLSRKQILENHKNTQYRYYVRIHS